MKKNNNDKTYIRISYFLIRRLLGPIIKLIWIKKVIGIENFPEAGPVIVAFNHESYFDFICFIAVAPRPVHYLSAEKFFTNKRWRFLMKVTGQIEVKRTERNKEDMHKSVYEHLNSNKVIGIFPEGTRAPFKEEMLKAFTGVAKYAIVGKVPIIPVGLYGTFDIMSRHDKVPKLKKFVSINIGEPIYLDKFYDNSLTKEDYELITDKIMLRISKLSGKIYPHYTGELDF